MAGLTPEEIERQLAEALGIGVTAEPAPVEPTAPLPNDPRNAGAAALAASEAVPTPPLPGDPGHPSAPARPSPQTVAPAPAPAPQGDLVPQTPEDIESQLRTAIDERSDFHVSIVPGLDLSIDVPEAARPVFQAANGFNENLAFTIGAVPEAVASALSLAGMDILDNPHDAQKIVKEAFVSAGLLDRADGDKVDSFARQVGRETFTNSIGLIAFLAAAPAMAAKTGHTTMAYLSRLLGDVTRQAPAAVVAGEVGATIGGVAGERNIGGPLGTMAGALPGALTGTTVVRGAEAAVEGIKAVGRSAQRLFGRNPPAASPATSLVDTNTAAIDATNAAEKVIAGDVAMMDASITVAANKIKGSPTAAGDTIEASGLFQRRLEAVERRWRKVEASKRYWGGVRTGLPVTVDPAVVAARRIAKQYAEDTPGLVPKQIARVLAWQIRDDAGNVIGMRRRNIGQLRTMQSELLGNIRQARKDLQPPTLIRNMAKLSASITKAIGDTYPNDKLIQESRAFTNSLHDRFTRGPVGPLLRSDEFGAPVVDPGEAVTKLTRTFGGPQSVANIDDAKLTRQFELALETQIREAVADKGPVEARKLMRQFGLKLKRVPEMARAQTLFTRTGEQLDQFFEQTKQINASALARFSKLAPEKGIASVLSSGKAKDAKAILDGFKGDTTAIEGFRTGIVEEIFSRSNLDPTRMELFINRPDIARVLEEVLPTNRLERLHRLVRAGKVVGQGGEKSRAKKLLTGPTTLIAGLLGAKGGQLLGTGTIQAPGILAGASRNIVRTWLSGDRAVVLLAKAVQDPAYEKFLISQLPSSPESLEAMTGTMRRLMSTAEMGKAILSEVPEPAPQPLTEQPTSAFGGQRTPDTASPFAGLAGVSP